jgi:glycerate 2-kinase
MRYLVASDKFKGTLSAPEACQAIAAAIRSVEPQAEVLEIPIADGGEGTARLLGTQLGAELHQLATIDPIGREISAEFFLSGSEAYLDMSAASGLWRVQAAALNPLRASTYGTGILLWHLIEQGATRINIGLGGSATVDAGLGMAAALGYRFENESGDEIEPLPEDFLSIVNVRAPSRSRLPKVIGLADVTTPLLGANGATYTFGRQKGLREDQLATFDSTLAQLVARLKKALGSDYSGVPGAGAAGGFGYGLMTFLDGVIIGGFDLFAEKLALAEKIAGVDVVITGEGRLDAQSLQGKGPFGVARLARTNRRPVWAIAGTVDRSSSLDTAFDRVSSLVDENVSPEEAMTDPVPLLQRRMRELLESNQA